MRNPPLETAIADWFVDAVRARRIKGGGRFEGMDGRLHLIRHEHPYVWMWIVQGPSLSMPGFTRVTPYEWHRLCVIPAAPSTIGA